MGYYFLERVRMRGSEILWTQVATTTNPRWTSTKTTFPPFFAKPAKRGKTERSYHRSSGSSEIASKKAAAAVPTQRCGPVNGVQATRPKPKCKMGRPAEPEG